MILTDQEILAAITSLYQNETVARMALDVSIDDYRAIEQAVIAKLAGVSVEPVAWMRPSVTENGIVYDSSFRDENGMVLPETREEQGFERLYTAEALAAARLQGEQGAIKRLIAGVSVEPSYYWEPDGTIEWMKEGSGFSTNTGPAHGWKITHYYTATAIAAARVAALEEAAVAADLFCNGGESQRPLKYPVATAIRALIGGAT